jgi:hypothetical protein
MPQAAPRPATADSIQPRRAALPSGWRKLSTGFRGAHLYLVKRHDGVTFWLVEVLRTSERLSQRFASELHARAWLKDLLRPGLTPASFDWEEMNVPLRDALRHARGASHGG